METDYFEEAEQNIIAIKKLRVQFSDEVYRDTVKELALILRKSADKNIQKYRTQYSLLDSFAEKTDFFKKTLVHMETAYKKMCQELLQKPFPYELWVTPHIYDQMKSNGFRSIIAYHMSMGTLYENSI